MDLLFHQPSASAIQVYYLRLISNTTGIAAMIITVGNA
jgi:hypothetical protein